MRKFGVFSSTIFISIMVAGLYGIIHDQITYTISNEYFTKYKYLQFGFDPERFGGHRQTVAVIGFLATWWTGLIIGFCLSLISLIFGDHKKMYVAIKNAIIIIFCITASSGFFGFLYGRFYLAKRGVWWVAHNVINTKNYITVGSIHNFSYWGGFIGLLIGIVYLIRLNSIQKRV